MAERYGADVRVGQAAVFGRIIGIHFTFGKQLYVHFKAYNGFVFVVSFHLKERIKIGIYQERLNFQYY